MKKVIPLTIQSGMSQSGSYIMMLGEVDGKRQIPIFIGAHEAEGIMLAQQPVKTRRPMTHETMLAMMGEYGLTLREVTIDRVVDGIFYATLHISDGFNEKAIDSRTTDAVTLALLTGCPIMVDDHVLDETGVEEIPAPAPLTNERSLELLEEELRQCEEREDYERAAEIQKEIEKLRK
ncbi:MAG: bifunctional nuclease family protein [Bacteroidales bacterium]|nr:bifunctional nuclease family protein [Bacteroidales bacterium]